MKKVLLTLVFGLFFVAFSNAQTAGATVKKAEYSVKKEKTSEYQCPMDCEKGKTYDKAGTCPTCKMDLKAKTNKKSKGCCSGKKAKSSCAGKAKASCGSKAKSKASCSGKSKASCAGKAKASCGSKK